MDSSREEELKVTTLQRKSHAKQIRVNRTK
jgi:hypothetical protein